MFLTFGNYDDSESDFFPSRRRRERRRRFAEQLSVGSADSSTVPYYSVSLCYAMLCSAIYTVYSESEREKHIERKKERKKERSSSAAESWKEAAVRCLPSVCRLLAAAFRKSSFLLSLQYFLSSFSLSFHQLLVLVPVGSDGWMRRRRRLEQEERSKKTLQ